MCMCVRVYVCVCMCLCVCVCAYNSCLTVFNVDYYLQNKVWAAPVYTLYKFFPPED